jgi:outer membrane protein
MKFRLLPLTVSLAAVFTASAQAQSLAQLYEAAKGYDASYKAAQSQYQANLAKAEQANAADGGLGFRDLRSEF